MAPKTQPGEGIVVVVDVGPLTRLGLPIEETFFNQAKTCLINILQRKLFADKCRDRVGVVLFGTDGTDNSLATPGQYQHITVLQEPRLVDWGSVEAASALPRGSHSADWLDALVVAMDLLHDPQGYSSKKIVLLTDFSGDFSVDNIKEIVSGIKRMKVDLSIIGPDMGDDDCCFSWNGKPKTKVQMAAESVATNIVNEVDGIICSFDEAIPQLIFFQKKSSGSANWNSVLDIGEDFRIPVTGRIKMKRATINTWTRCHAMDDSAVIIKERSYHKLDDQQTAVDDDMVIDGYRYGTTMVPFSDDSKQMSYSSGAESAQLSVLGFTRSEHCSLPLRAGDQVLVVTAKDGDEEGAVALSSIIQALTELDMVAISRRVYRKGTNPVMGALFPHITPQYECLVWVPLPYQEDVRNLSFPSIRRYTDALTADQLSGMDSLIDAMNLCPEDSDGDAEELLEPSSVLNPQLQHHYNCLTDRSVHPGRPLPVPHSHVTALLAVPAEVQEALDGVAERLLKLFPTTKVVRRTKRERENVFGKDTDANVSKRSRDDEEGSDDDVSVTLGARVTQVSTATPLQDFTAMIHQQPHNFLQICQQVCEVLLQLVETVTGAADNSAEWATGDKIINCLQAFRRESLVIDPASYNKFLRQFKALVVGRGLGGGLWERVGQEALGLLTTEETQRSAVTGQEAQDFLKLEETTEQAQPPPPPPTHDQDYDDLLDDL